MLNLNLNDNGGDGDEGTFSEAELDKKVIFVKREDDISSVDMSDLVDEAAIQLRKEIPQELVVKMFQQMVSGLSVSFFSFLCFLFFLYSFLVFELQMEVMLQNQNQIEN